MRGEAMTSHPIKFTPTQLQHLTLDDVAKYEPYFNNDAVVAWGEQLLATEREEVAEVQVIATNKHLVEVLNSIERVIQLERNHTDLTVSDVLAVLDEVAERIKYDETELLTIEQLTEDLL